MEDGPALVGGGRDQHADELAEIEVEGKHEVGESWQRLAEMSKELTALAAAKGVPVLAAAQLNRGGDLADTIQLSNQKAQTLKADLVSAGVLTQARADEIFS